MESSAPSGPGPKLFQILGKQLARVRGTLPACRTYHILTNLVGPAATPRSRANRDRLYDALGSFVGISRETRPPREWEVALLRGQDVGSMKQSLMKHSQLESGSVSTTVVPLNMSPLVG